MKRNFNTEIYGLLPTGVAEIGSLVDLALDMRWSWNHEADELWKALDPALWELTHNPWTILQTISKDQLERQLADPSFKRKIEQLAKLKELSLLDIGWFRRAHPDSHLSCVAYFSMEYMLSEALPIYVGGLGNVAGDQLKSASDLNIPIVAVGLLYGQGYFRQEIDKNGSQLALFPYNDPGQLPITPLRLPNGEWLRIKVSLPGYPVWLRTWQVQVGKLKLYLLDSNDVANLPWHRGITNEIYGGGAEIRIKQEIVLGIGGWKLLRAIGIQPEVCHMNEGHAAFLVLERASDFMKTTGISFPEALAITRAGNIFTTHTAVAAGFDNFSPLLMEEYFETYAKEELNISFHDLMALGKECSTNSSENFKMAFLAIRGSGAVNGVSNSHSIISRKFFQILFPRWPTQEVPVDAVTNGVHMPTWDSEFADEVWTEACGKERWKGDLQSLHENINQIPDGTLWEMRSKERLELVDYVRKRFERQVTVVNQPHMAEIAKQIFDSSVLTLGFARRFVPYKRPTLLLHDEERFVRILTNPEKPVQMVIAGKAPPYDESSKAFVKEWIQFIRRHNLYQHVVFLTDYDMLLTEHMVQGVDVWINTPRRPWEACGTSGMKVLVNGGLNLSALDGWWTEAYTLEVGWAICDVGGYDNDLSQDEAEANALYNILENEVIPLFYERNERRIPEKWIKKVRKSMAVLTPQFSAIRTVQEYTEKYYLPAAAKFLHRAANKGAVGKRIVTAEQQLAERWKGIHFNEVRIESIEGGYAFNASIFFNGIDPAKVRVELYANGLFEKDAECTPMHLLSADNGENLYCAEVRTMRCSSDYTVRIIPAYENVAIPLENNLILWQR